MSERENQDLYSQITLLRGVSVVHRVRRMEEEQARESADRAEEEMIDGYEAVREAVASGMSTGDPLLDYAAMVLDIGDFFDNESMDKLKRNFQLINEMLKGNIEQPILIVEPFYPLTESSRPPVDGHWVHDFTLHDLNFRGGTITGEDLVLDPANGSCFIPAINCKGKKSYVDPEISNRNLEIKPFNFNPTFQVDETIDGTFMNIFIGRNAIGKWIKSINARSREFASEDITMIFKGGTLAG